MDIFSKHITDREEKHCGCGDRGSHGAYTGNGYEDYRGYGDRIDYGSQAECSSCAIFNGLNESRSSCGCGSSNSYNDSRVFETNRSCGSCASDSNRGSGSCSCEPSRSGSCSCESSRCGGSCSCDSNRGNGSCSCDSNRGNGSCSCDTSPSYSSCSCDTSPSYNSCSCDTSPSYSSCSCDTYEESGCCDTYKESRSCGSCSTYGNDNYGSCNPCAERKSCDSGSSDSCSCVNPSCGIYVHCDSCGYYEPKGCDNHGSSECSCNDTHNSYGNDCGCGCQNEPRSCGCAGYDSYSESSRCNVCNAPRVSCECGSYGRASSQGRSCACKGRDGGRKGDSEEFSLGFNSFAGFSSHIGVKCYEKLQGKPKKCRKRGKLRCRCKTDMIQRGICDIKKGLELSQKGYKEICCNSFYEGEQSLCAAIEVIRKGLIDFNKGLPDVQPCVTCDGWRILYMGVCHIDAGLKELCKGNKELSKHCYDKCSTEEIKKGICSLEEGLKKFTKALIDILY